MRALCRPASLSASASPLGVTIQQPLAAVGGAFLLLHIALVDELLEDAAERLLGDPQDAEKLRDLHAGIAVDEVQDPVMGTAEAELGQHLVGVADEIAVGEKQQLDQVPDGLRPVPGFGRNRDAHIYVSHVDIFFGFVTMMPCFATGTCWVERIRRPLHPSRNGALIEP